MSKTSFVQINGKLYQKTGDNTVIIDGQNWHCYAGRWMPEGSFTPGGYTVLPDIAPYKSVIDGSVIGSRSTHRAHLREHNCIEVGNERPTPRREAWTALKGLREELAARLNQ